MDASAQLIRQVLDHLPHPILVVREDRIVEAANQQARRMGARVGAPCWLSFSGGEFLPEPCKGLLRQGRDPASLGRVQCTFCQADTCLAEGKVMVDPGRRLWQRYWEIYWIPLDDRRFLHYAIDVTETVQAYSLQESLGRIVENALGELYVFDARTLRFLLVNRGARANLGYTMGELQRMTPLDIKPDFDWCSFTDLIRPLQRGERECLHFVTDHRRKDGSRYPAEVLLQRFDLAGERVYLALVKDISEYRDKERALRRSRDEWVRTFHALEDTVVLLTPDLRVARINGRGLDWLGLEEERVLGRRCHEVAHRRAEPCDQSGEECPLIRARASGRSHSCLHAHYDDDGEVRWVRIQLYPITASDGRRYYAETVEEIAPEDRPAGLRSGERRMVGCSRLFLEMVEALTSAAATIGPVLLMGETGTGKELAARFIHRHSERARRPFLCLDCAAVPEPLFESELFGHERGAFTGSTGRRIGMVELAHGGTLFLDEIGELPPQVQAKLLRVLESREVRRVGGEEMVPVDIRIVAATNRPLWAEVAEGRFREDLFHRIACFTVELPPLRDRMEDLPLIVEELLRHMPPPAGRPLYGISEAAVEALKGYRYPGNVRELRNLLQVAAAYAGAGKIETEMVLRAIRERQDHIPVAARDRVGVARGTRATPPPPAESERIYLADALARHGGHRRRTADALGMSERTLYRKLKRYGLR